jgi:signal peptidase I
MARPGARGVLLVSLLIALGGCGGGGSAGADKVKASFAQYVRDLQRHEVAGACDGMTPAFWSALAGELKAELVTLDRSISATNCRAGLRSLFALAGHATIFRSGVHAADVVVHGTSATAREVGGGLRSVPVSFVEQGGRWRVACCIGRQREQQAQASYRIPSGSMLPTLRLGQVVVSDNAALRAHPPALGAIVVFHPPAGADTASPTCGAAHEGAGFARACGKPTAGESSQTFIKRVVGLPGDTIALVQGTVIRDGEPEPRTYHVVPCGQEPACTFRRPITVPPDEYFMLGDNLPASDDSRFWGPVKRSWLIGVVRVGR